MKDSKALDVIFDAIVKNYPHAIPAIMHHLKEKGIIVEEKDAEFSNEYLQENGLATPVDESIGGDFGLRATIKSLKIYKSQSFGNGLSSFLSSERIKKRRKRIIDNIIKIATFILAVIGGVYSLWEMICKK